MKSVVITGSARGFGFEMIKLFKNNNFNTVLCDINQEALDNAKALLEKEKGEGKVLAIKADVTNEQEVSALINQVINELGSIDYWINNAGVNQPDKPI